MAFVLKPKSEGFYYGVILPVVNESGASQAIKFEMKFKRVSRSKLNDLQKAQEQMTESEVVVDSLERDTDYVMDIAEGWRYVSETDGAEDLPFNRANVWLMLNNYPNAASVIVAAFFEATLGGGKRKN
jgi:hypothetical protein